jgi:diaminopropionate ammonia-lyase
MLQEVDQQIIKLTDGYAVTAAVASVGVGSWAHSVVAHYKSTTPPATVITVEPTAAPCLNTSLQAGEIVSIETGNTIMNGMNCGTVSTIAWPYLRDGVDASVVIEDPEAHQAVLYLAENGVKGGPCGAAPLVALKKVVLDGTLPLGKKDVVVLFCTEGARDYVVPG